MTASIASSILSCSQTLTTFQPSRCRAWESAKSLALFLFNLATQYVALVLGVCPCSGQECQKHPSTKTATRRLGKTMSGRTLRPDASTGASTRNRQPWRCNVDRKSSSGFVSRRRLARMVAAAAELEATGGVREERPQSAAKPTSRSSIVFTGATTSTRECRVSNRCRTVFERAHLYELVRA